ncbi:SpoIIE family protein phosphatase [Solimonas sp. SE-A11]|uniref:ATP-binding SpoIIE family protein phosphatase n=1 Tax=Solimonas sp. SE-A11 TaxID=3054954 RepID=UPI00259CE660|nr:SpoIIE family protein phosphatase [Solimonas sp. SE-A11]MDM4769309.1 SpoIIE family protein phosphatase [Solimonas sp. SE-A11]
MTPGMPAGTSPGTDYLSLFAELLEDFASLDIELSMVRRALGRIAEAMNAESACLFLLEGEHDDPRARLVCQASVGPSDITGLSLPVGTGVVGRAVQRDEPQLVADTRLDPDFVPPSAQMDYQIRSLICVPLSVKGQRLGAVEVVNRRDCDNLFSERDCEALATLANAAALALTNARLMQQQVEQARTRRELELAASVQRALLPRDGITSEWVRGVNLPARGVSGDFYDVLPLAGGSIAFALADVSGKGMNAALVAVKAATLFRSEARQMRKPGKLLARIGTELMETMSQGMFVTMVVGIYDPRSYTVRFANAGHEPPVWRDRNGQYQAFPAEEPPLGIVMPESGIYPETVLRLDGGSLYLYTDGCTESRDERGAMRGAEGIQALIGRYASLPLAERVQALADSLAPDGADLRDDITLLVVEGKASRRARRDLLLRQSFPAEATQLKVIRHLVADIAGKAGMAAETAQELVLAVDEACQNIIRHGYRDHVGGRIDLSMRRVAGRLTVELVDFAPPVKQDECKGRPLEELRPGGLGTFFMSALTDSMKYLRPPRGAGNRLALSKRLAGKKQGGQE